MGIDADVRLPDVITDALEAQRQMRAAIRDVTYCLMIATMLHSVAVGNLLPAWVKVVCVDINPSTAIKLSDRAYILEKGHVRFSGSIAALHENEDVRRQYLGV